MSKFVVSARKYRPTKFEEVIGQNHVAKTLGNALVTNKLAHAFLFCGPRGVGKTTCARILAKVINCENPVNQIEPCNECSSCKSFNDNASFNIIELDAASNNSVEHIRTLIEQVRFQPQQGSHKVFIIDEVHMLSSQAFNAFLKTLEEPPPYAIFILATTEKHKILPTILSRCQIFDFKRIQPKDIVTQLNNISSQEGKTADHEALFQIASKADGAMRDALSIYDKIASATGDHISYKDVVVNLNILDYDYYFKMVDAMLKSDLSSVFLHFDEVIKNGFEPDLFIQGLSSHLRELLVSKDKATVALLECSDELKQRYYNQASLANKSFILSALNILNQCDILLPRSNNKRLHSEIALSKICHLHHAFEAKPFGEVAPSSSSSTQTGPVSKPKLTVAPTKIVSTVEETKVVNKVVSSFKAEEKVKPKTGGKIEIPSIGKGSLPSLNALKNKIKAEEESKKESQKLFNLENLQILWNEYIDATSSTSIKAALGSTVLDIEGDGLIIAVPSPTGKSIIGQENALIEGIRKKFGIDSLHVTINIDKSMFPGFDEKIVKKALSPNETLVAMMEKNKDVKTLVSAFDLKIKD